MATGWSIKKIGRNYSEAQNKVREATSNDPWGPPTSLMSEIAELTYNVVAFTEIMCEIWKRLNDNGKNWRHVYKALVLLENLIKVGSEKVSQQCCENIFALQTLKSFQYIDKDGKDHGMNVREKSKSLVALLKDGDRLKQVRFKALKTKEKFPQTSHDIVSTSITRANTSLDNECPGRKLYQTGKPVFDSAETDYGKSLAIQEKSSLLKDEVQRKQRAPPDQEMPSQVPQDNKNPVQVLMEFQRQFKLTEYDSKDEIATDRDNFSLLEDKEQLKQKAVMREMKTEDTSAQDLHGVGTTPTNESGTAQESSQSEFSTDVAQSVSQPSLDDTELYHIAADIGTSDKVIPLGLVLGFKRAQIKQYQQTNMSLGEVSCSGTWNMLCDWKESVGKSEQKSLLFSALTKAKLVSVAEDHLQ